MNPQDHSESTRTGFIAGRVTTAEGVPAPDVRIFISDSTLPHPDIALLTDDDGRYRLDDLLPGDYTITVLSDRHGELSRKALVEAGGITELDFSFS